MRVASGLLWSVVLAAVAAACSAGSSSLPSSHGARAGAAGSGGGEGGASGEGGAGGVPDDASVDDTSAGGAAGDDASAGGSGGTDPADAGLFGGGWHPPDTGSHPALVGDGSTTVDLGAGVASGAPSQFGGGADPGAAPTLIYPPDGVIFPPNLNSLEIHFIPGAGQTLFEIALHAPTKSLSVYTKCTPLNGGCVWTTDAAFWSQLVPYARGAAPVTYTVRGVGSSGLVGASTTRTMAFAEQDVNGGIYYWNTAGVVQRYDFGYPNLPPENFMTTFTSGALVCVGCHVVSRDGRRILVGKDIPAPAPYGVFDVGTRAPLQSGSGPVAGSANFATFAPDSTQMITSDGVWLSWRDLLSGNTLNPTLAPGTQPDWSPDGTSLAYTSPQSPPPFGIPMPGVDSGSIDVLRYDGTSWSGPSVLVPFTGQNNYYPTYAPTGDWVLFNRSPDNRNSFANGSVDQDAGTVPDGELWAVAATGGAPVRLSRATDPGWSSWPKWAPTVHDAYSGKILWLTFSSARGYGLRLASGTRSQLWMVGFDLTKAAAGQDPSFAAFWLPFQDMSGGNHIAQWATKVVRAPCTDDAQCTSNRCVNHECAPS